MNKRNYQRELDMVIESLTTRPKLLLHACCAPCSSYCIAYLAQYFDIALLYYNPNISPKEEYDTRVEELHRLVREMLQRGALPAGSVEVIEGDYEPERFEIMSQGLENEKEGSGRCYRCYEMRLAYTAEYAKENGYEYFTTTLSISPLKNAQWINEIGERLAEKYGIKHLPSEFKKKGGYLKSTELSKEYNLYRQNFCGCIYSRRETGGIKKE